MKILIPISGIHFLILASSATIAFSGVPQISLSFGHNQWRHGIREGNDMYFRCRVQNSVTVQEVHWKFEGNELTSDASAGVIISNKEELVLLNVGRRNIGKYSCTATNPEGTAESNDVYLTVLYAPVCKSNQTTVYRAMPGVPVEITCEFDGDPEEAVFRWQLRSESTATLQLNPTMTIGSRSVLHYTPQTEQDYGTISCWAENTIGMSKNPCDFVVISAAALSSTLSPISSTTVLQHEDSHNNVAAESTAENTDFDGLTSSTGTAFGNTPILQANDSSINVQHYSPAKTGKLAGYIIGAFSISVFILSVIGYNVKKHHLKKNSIGKNLYNPVHNKTTEDHLRLENNQYSQAISSSSFEPVTTLGT